MFSDALLAQCGQNVLQVVPQVLSDFLLGVLMTDDVEGSGSRCGTLLISCTLRQTVSGQNKQC